MPLFSRSGFKSGKKPVKRKSFSLGNLSSLDETTYSINDLKLDSAGPLTMRLSGHEFVFTKGQWVLGKRRGNGWFIIDFLVPKDGSTPGSATGIVEASQQLQKENKRLVEENNLLRYKTELLLDMLALSNADNFNLKEEIESLKKVKKKTKKKQ